jgi:hypothetical protein
MPGLLQGIEPSSCGKGNVASPKVGIGVSLPLWAHEQGTGINFAIFNRQANNFMLL